MNQGIHKIEIRIFGLTVVTIVIKTMNTRPEPTETEVKPLTFKEPSSDHVHGFGT